MKKKKLDLSVLQELKGSASLREKTNFDEGFHQKILKYPKKWHRILKESKGEGNVHLTENAYICEAIKEKMQRDDLI